MQDDDDWEIWIHEPGHIDDISNHVLVASDLDHATATILINKVNRLVITRQAPDVAIYMRRPFDLTYRVKLNGKTTRTRFTHDAARAMFAAYKQTFTQPKYIKHWQCKLVRVDNNALRDPTPDMAFLPRVLCDDPVYGEHPLVLRDPSPLYFGETITMEHVMAILASVDAKKIARIVREAFTAYKNRHVAPECRRSKVRMLAPRVRRRAAK